MHEIGLCESLVRAVEQEAAGQPVEAVRARLGASHHIDEDAVRTGFAVAAQGTVAADATLELEVVPGVATCAACGEQTSGSELFPLCPSCGNPDLVAGDELVLEAVSVREPSSIEAARDARAGEKGD